MNNVLILTYWSYKDALVQTYTLPYVHIIRKNLNPSGKIFILTLEQDFFKMSDEEWQSENEKLKKDNIFLIRFKYDHFGIKMIFRVFALLIHLTRLIFKEKIGTIHSWCTPAGALGYILSLLTSKPLIIDSYEPHAESMVENGTWSATSFKYKLLFWLEKKQSQRATTVIALTKGMRDYAATKYQTTFEHYFVKPALVNLEKFNWDSNRYHTLRQSKGLNDKVVCVYAGKLGGIYLEEEVFDFFKTASDFWGEKLKVYLLTDKAPEIVNRYIQQKNIPKNCIETLFVPYQKIQDYMQLADFAINPVKPVPSKRYCTSIKDGEYWAMGLPIVITKNISDDSEIIQKENIGYVLQDLSEKEYVNACENIDTLIKMDKKKLTQKIISVAKKYRSYEIADLIYSRIYN